MRQAEKAIWKRLLIMLILPAILNFLVSMVIYGVGYSVYSDPELATNKVMAAGPFYWSALHLFFFFLIFNFLKREGKTLRELIGFSKLQLKKDILIGVAIALIWVGIIGGYWFLMYL
jgi:hypothetical protein